MKLVAIVKQLWANFRDTALYNMNQHIPHKISRTCNGVDNSNYKKAD